jgi:hypothetical protein
MNGLLRGGLASTSKNLESTVATALGRLRDEGIVLRFPDGWDLAESYPESLRNRLNGKSASKATTPERTPEKPAPKKADVDGDDKTATILKLIVDEPNGQRVSDIVKALDKQGIKATPDYVRVVVQRLKKRTLARVENGLIMPTGLASVAGAMVS